MLRLKNDATTPAGIREAARLGFNIIKHGINKPDPNPHTARKDRKVRAIERALRRHRS